MARTPSTEDVYEGDGTTAVFQFHFPFLHDTDVFVSVDGVNVSFTILPGSTAQVQLTVPPADGSIVKVYRSTLAYVPEHLFASGVPFLPRYVDENNRQLLYASQEAINDTAVTAAEALVVAEEAKETAERAESKIDGAIIDSSYQLRLDLDSTELTKGAALVRAANGVTVQDLMGTNGALYLQYMNRSQYSRNADRVHIFDYIPYVEHAAILNHTSTYDCRAAFLAAITALKEGGTLYLPDGVMEVVPVGGIGIPIDKIGITIVGQNSGHAYYTSRINVSVAGSIAVKATQPQCSALGVSFYGPGAAGDGGAGNTAIGLDLSAPTQNNNLDMVFERCTFSGFGDGCLFHGRNLKFNSCLFQNNAKDVRLGDDGYTDMRGLTMLNCRHHSCGVAGNASNIASIVLPGAQNFFELLISNAHADDCVNFFHGWASGRIQVVHVKAKGHGLVIDSTGVTVATARKALKVDLVYQQENATTQQCSAITSVGTHSLVVNILSKGSGGPAIQNQTVGARYFGHVENAGQVSTNTHPAVYMTADCNLEGLTIAQDIAQTVTNKASYAITSTVTAAPGNVRILGTNWGTGIYNIPQVRGPVPTNSPPAVGFASAAPTSGTWSRGDIIWNTAPSASGFAGWICTASGTPGTWKTFAVISA